MGELTAGAYPARNGNGGGSQGNLIWKFVWGLLTALSTAALVMAGSMLLEHDRALARQQVKNETIDDLVVAVVKVSENVSLLQQDIARRDGRDAGEREFRNTRTGGSTTSP